MPYCHFWVQNEWMQVTGLRKAVLACCTAHFLFFQTLPNSMDTPYHKWHFLWLTVTCLQYDFMSGGLWFICAFKKRCAEQKTSVHNLKLSLLILVLFCSYFLQEVSVTAAGHSLST